ncbi:hypothetical protein MMC13_007415 [Lambiella insularis]|nr:hypothetical protein [Lambiella insularis]
MFYDLNVPYTTNHAELQRTLAFLAELGYSTVALNHTISGKLPPDLTSPIPHPLPFPTPPRLRILTRITLDLSTPATTPRLPALLPHYHLLALAPTTPQTLTLACQAANVSLISLDLTSTRLFILPRKTLSLAIQNGIRFEIRYGAGVLDGAGGGGAARRNLISNATALVRATQGRGIVVSSEAGRALACRGPWDVGNLAEGWGLSGERGREAVGRAAMGVVARAEAMRGGWRGVIDVVHGGEKPVEARVAKGAAQGGLKGKGKDKGKQVRQGKAEDEAAKGIGKRKAEVLEEDQNGEEKPVSKRELKRRAKKARTEAAAGTNGEQAASTEVLEGTSAARTVDAAGNSQHATNGTPPAEATDGENLRNETEALEAQGG